MRRLLVFPLLLLASSASLEAQIDARMLRHPDVSATQIVFVYAGDLWLVAREGGVAHRLSSPSGEEQFPRFSPDGRKIAFTGNYDGNQDVYVISSEGGVPERITHHPAADRIVDWYPDGASLLYASTMSSASYRFSQLFKTPAHGGLPELLPLAYGEFAALVDGGREIVFQTMTREFRTWKRYRGGMAPDLWWVDLDAGRSRRLTTDPANDSLPMLHGRTLYFLSDRDSRRRANLWALDLDGGQPRQVTSFRDDDVRFPAIGPADIVFENGGRLYLLGLADEKVREVKVQVIADRRALRPRIVEVADYFSGAGTSPSGQRALVEARGEIFSLPAEHGVVRNLTSSSGVAERHPAWSPDGRWIAYFSDRSGEYELTLKAADGSGDERRVTTLGPGYRYWPFWSPDSKQIAFVDQTFTIRVVDVESREIRVVDKALRWSHGPLSAFEASWSADSRWMTYHRDLENGNDAVFVWDSRNGETHQLTSGFYSASRPVFDPGGAYLYHLSEREFEPSYSSVDEGWAYANSTRIVAVPLRGDVDSPLAPRNDEEKSEDEEKAEGGAGGEDSKSDAEGAQGGGAPEKTDEVAEVTIDLEGFESRTVVLPPAAGRYDNLRAVDGKVLYRRRPRTGSGERQSPMVYWDLEKREEQTVLDDVDGFEITADGKKALVGKDSGLAFVGIAPSQKMDKKLPVDEMRMSLDPRLEWRQLFADAWRLERDFFYDPHLHGVDWERMRVHYAKLLEAAETRWDVNFVIGELIGELNASHAYRSGGDEETSEREGVGLLGVDFELDRGAYRIARIVQGAAWDNEVRSPLLDARGEVREGDYLLAVNGVPVDAGVDPWAAFQGLAGKTVMLTVNDSPSTDGAREVFVETLRSEAELRNRAWVEENRLRVDRATGGRVGYIYVPDTGIGGQNELVRQFQGQIGKGGLVIDERFNSGGQVPSRFIELLSRRRSGFVTTRYGLDVPQAFSSVGPMVMLINHWAGSGGDLFPWLFREAGLGPLIGTRTWGGLIGISGSPQLIDGGSVTVPSFGFYDNQGKWLIEGHGVDPDIEVIDDPAQMLEGGDPQLDRAIQEVLERLESVPEPPRRPAYEDRS